MTAIKEIRTQLFHVPLAEVLVDYMTQAGPYTPYMDGRITLK